MAIVKKKFTGMTVARQTFVGYSKWIDANYEYEYYSNTLNKPVHECQTIAETISEHVDLSDSALNGVTIFHLGFRNSGMDLYLAESAEIYTAPDDKSLCPEIAHYWWVLAVMPDDYVATEMVLSVS
jgi:hypothetical protein